MELDEMKQAWQVLERRLDRQHALQFRLFRDRQMDRFRGGLRPLVWGQSLQLLTGVAIAIWVGTFWVSHRAVAHLLVCGLLVQGLGLAMIIFAARVLVLVQQMDHAAPVATLQRQLADLRHWRVRVEAPINGIAGCFGWIPVLVMSLAAHGIDIWRVGLLHWALINSVVGLCALVLVVWLLRRAGFGARLEAHIAGRSVQRAQAALDDIGRFERE